MTKQREAPFVPDLGADWRGGNIISDNIRMVDYETGKVILHNMAEPASKDPHDYTNLCGKFIERKKKEDEEILKRNLDRTSGR
jgi:hypothetical protein